MDGYDVVVIGAGLAGLECARGLGEAGARVLLADRRLDLARSVRTTGIFVRRTLEDFDLPEGCLGPPIRRVTLYSPSRRGLVVESRRDEFRIARMAELYRRRLEACRRAGVAWAPGTVYRGGGPERGGVTVELHGPGSGRTVHARLIVGADGTRSLVARDLGLDVNREWIVAVEDVFRGGPGARPPGLHCVFDPRLAPGYIAWVADDGEEIHVGVGGYAARFDPVQALAAFEASRPADVDLTRAPWRERRGGHIPVGGVLRRIACPYGVLVGDAAGAVSPLTAGGLDPCLRLSRLAVRVIADLLGSGDAGALAAYAGHRFRARFTSRLWMRRLATAVRSPWLAELACAALRSGPLRALAAHVFFGDGSFPDARPEPVREPVG